MMGWESLSKGGEVGCLLATAAILASLLNGAPAALRALLTALTLFILSIVAITVFDDLLSDWLGNKGAYAYVEE